jgi:hypothetical protein
MAYQIQRNFDGYPPLREGIERGFVFVVEKKFLILFHFDSPRS